MAKTVQELKCTLFDVIERQALLNAENQRLETLKGDLVKELNEARQAEANAAETATAKASA